MSSVLGSSPSLLSKSDSISFTATASKSEFVVFNVAASVVTLAETSFLEVTQNAI